MLRASTYKACGSHSGRGGPQTLPARSTRDTQCGRDASSAICDAAANRNTPGRCNASCGYSPAPGRDACGSRNARGKHYSSSDGSAHAQRHHHDKCSARGGNGIALDGSRYFLLPVRADLPDVRDRAVCVFGKDCMTIATCRVCPDHSSQIVA